MFTLILQALWFVLPAGLANIAPVIIKQIPLFDFLNIPIDAGKTFRGKRIFGDNKTVRGFVAGYVLAALTTYLQLYLYNNSVFVYDTLALFDYNSLHPLLWALLAGYGALLGDAIESFFKRQTNHPPGSNWFPFDQIDFIAGFLLLSAIAVQLTITEYTAVIIVMFLLHPAVNIFGYLIRVKDSPF